VAVVTVRWPFYKGMVESRGRGVRVQPRPRGRRGSRPSAAVRRRRSADNGSKTVGAGSLTPQREIGVGAGH
jgi:hypothetical protein